MEEKEEVRCYTIRDLFEFIGETGVDMDTKLRVAGGDFVYTLTFIPSDNVLAFDESRYE